MLVPAMRVSALGGNFAFFTPIDDRSLAFAGDGSRKPVWIPAAAQGVWYNARHGEVPITADDIERMFTNFREGLYPPKPQELPIDYEHLSVKPDRKAGDGKAAGWIKDLEVRENAELDRKELWALVEWNDDGAKSIEKKEYRGFSPLFHPNWITHGKKELGVTLLGGALTNYQTIPDCVVTCSMDPQAASRRYLELSTLAVPLASVDQLPYSERERRVREAIDAKYPVAYRDGGADFSTFVYVRDVFDDRVIFTRGSKTYEQSYAYNDDLSVTFDGEAREVIVEYSPIAASNTGEPTMKVKNAKGEEVDIPAASFAGFTLDALAEIPVVKELMGKVPGADVKVVPAKEFDQLTTQVQTLSTEVNSLSSRATKAEDELKAAKVRERDAVIDGLIATGKILPADKEHLIELANEAPALFEKRVTALKTAQPVIRLGAEYGGSGGGEASSPIVAFDNLVASEKQADTKIDTAEAIKRAAAKNPELARARNQAISLPVGAGGLPMVSH